MLQAESITRNHSALPSGSPQKDRDRSTSISSVASSFDRIGMVSNLVLHIILNFYTHASTRASIHTDTFTRTHTHTLGQGFVKSHFHLRDLRGVIAFVHLVELWFFCFVRWQTRQRRKYLAHAAAEIHRMKKTKKQLLFT